MKLDVKLVSRSRTEIQMRRVASSPLPLETSVSLSLFNKRSHDAGNEMSGFLVKFPIRQVCSLASRSSTDQLGNEPRCKTGPFSILLKNERSYRLAKYMAGKVTSNKDDSAPTRWGSSSS